MKDMDKKRFIEILNSNVSHTIVVSFAFYNIFFPDCEGSYPFQWFVEDVCFMAVDVKYGMACFIMVGYLFYDYLLAKLWIRGNEAIDHQMNFHHVVAASATLTGIYSGYALSGIANVLLTMEASTVALNYRSLYDKKDFHMFIPTMLQGAFCLQFTAFRIILMPYVYVRFWFQHTLFWDAVPKDR